MLKGLLTTLLGLFQPTVTVQYPEVKRPVSSRFKGRHVLKRYDNGLEKCIGCSLCAAAARRMRSLSNQPKTAMRSAIHPASAMPALMKSICCAVFFAVFARTPAQPRRSSWVITMNCLSTTGATRSIPKTCCLNRFCRRATRHRRKPSRVCSTARYQK
jgi:hypothetical protein